MNAYRTPDERFEDLPEFDFAPNYLDQDGLRLHYLDEGSGAPILLLHGEPTWSFLYRKLIPTLRRAPAAVSRRTTSGSAGRTSRPTDSGTRTTGTTRRSSAWSVPSICAT